jgi:hypothetical protein
MFVQCIVYCVQWLLSSLWLKSVPGWPAISVSTYQQSRVGQIVWFGCLSAISQLASRVGEGGGVRQLWLGSLKMNTALEYSTRVVQEGGRRCKKSTLNDLVHLTPLRIPLMNPPFVSIALHTLYYLAQVARAGRGVVFPPLGNTWDNSVVGDEYCLGGVL